MTVADAVVLAGGTASRMGGVNKPALLVGGRSLLDRVLDALRGAIDGSLIVVGPVPSPILGAVEHGPASHDRPVVWVQEAQPGGGPLPALAAGLDEVQSALMVAMASDLPFVTPADVDALVRALDRSDADVAGAVVVDPAGRRQWLFSAWRTDALREAVLRRDRLPDRPLAEVLGQLRTVPVTVGVDTSRPPPWLDCDTASDLARARQVDRDAGPRH